MKALQNMQGGTLSGGVRAFLILCTTVGRFRLVNLNKNAV